MRIAQRSTRGGMGIQFLPRIDQEVLVQFIENDIDRKIVALALYNGQGEGGITPTPGCAADAGDSQAGVLDPAHDHAPSAQGNLAAGNSPLRHSVSGDSTGQRSGDAQCGVRSKEFGGAGYNQLLFDDTDSQGRVQLKSRHAASELWLGHFVDSTMCGRATTLRFSRRFLRVSVRVGRWAVRVSTSIHAGFSGQY